MNPPSAKALHKACKRGDAAKVRELIASNAPIETPDLNGLTPVMLAAQTGNREMFFLLVEHGANLQHIGLCDIDLLECAAEGGNVEIIRYLIKAGHPVDGHWQPRSKVAARTGHQTPLLLAAINGHVDAVKLLLDAGANPAAQFDNQTALQFVQSDIDYPTDAAATARIARLKEIAELLGQATAKA